MGLENSILVSFEAFIATVVRVKYEAYQITINLFRVSLALAPMLYIIVGKSEESKFWDERAKQKTDEDIIRSEMDDDEGNEGEVKPSALKDLLSSPFQRRQLVGMIGVLAAPASGFYMLFLYCPIYLSTLRGLLDEKEAGKEKLA